MHLNVEVHEEGFQSIKERRQSTRKRLAQNHTEKNSFSPPNTSRDPKHPLEESFYYSIKFTLRKYWVGQNVCSGFSITSYEKPKWTFWPTQLSFTYKGSDDNRNKKILPFVTTWVDPEGLGGGLAAKLWPTLCHPMDCSPLGSFVHEIFPARISEWVGISSSRRSSWLGDGTHISCISCIGRRIPYQ